MMAEYRYPPGMNVKAGFARLGTDRMAISKTPYGTFMGKDVSRFTLRNGAGVELDVMEWGATLLSLRVPLSGRTRDLVLGLGSLDEYVAKSPYFGATCGRFANRIAFGRFELDGKTYEVDRNQGGVHQLHGGSDNFSKRVWQGRPDPEDNAVNFQLTSPDGDQGYPGTVMAACTYRLDEDNCLSIIMTAASTRPTPINMAHHSYWNLEGKEMGIPAIDDQRLWLNADRYLPTGEGQIPTGELRNVAGTDFDFRDERRLADRGEPLIDHCFVVNESGGMRPVAAVRSSDGRVLLELSSNQPGVQVYTAFKLGIDRDDGVRIGPRSGLCLETEAFPNAPNEPSFPSSILRPGESYRHVMEHRLTFE
jgi:aldose 1-epimerase